MKNSKDYIEEEYGTRIFARALELKDGNSILDLMDDYADWREKQVIQSEKFYHIDFGGNIMARIKSSNDSIEVVAAMNGYGNPIAKIDITITEM